MRWGSCTPDTNGAACCCRTSRYNRLRHHELLVASRNTDAMSAPASNSQRIVLPPHCPSSLLYHSYYTPCHAPSAYPDRHEPHMASHDPYDESDRLPDVACQSPSPVPL